MKIYHCDYCHAAQHNNAQNRSRLYILCSLRCFAGEFLTLQVFFLSFFCRLFYHFFTICLLFIFLFMLRNDTICALATPPGAAGLAVVRLSGAEAISLADKCFRGKHTLAAVASHTLHYGVFHSVVHSAGTDVDTALAPDTALDTVVASVFRAPNSYTGEDVIEFGCHGGVIVSQEIVHALVAAGARMAEPGEFSKRAFLHQKLDLTQVEAVGDLIHAVSQHGSKTAARQLLGGFTTRLEVLRERLLHVCGLLELELDFSQEDLELIDRSEVLNELAAARLYCLELADAHRSSEILRSGYCVGIVGYPNAGKSSLLNALLGRQRAIVSDTPGTTRDYIEELIYLGGMAVKLIDTAGFRTSSDTIEVAGIRLAESLLAQCNLVLVLNDLTLGKAHSEPLLADLSQRFPQAECVVVHNKLDAAAASMPASMPASSPALLSVSARTSEGLDELKAFVAARARADTQHVSDALINARQAALLLQAASAIEVASGAVSAGASNEFVALDVREALKRIGEITGAVWNEEILNGIFAKFCIGK
jgi:tRNA modification GTPase